MIGFEMNQFRYQLKLGLISVMVLIILMHDVVPSSGQITFSKDWRAGGKRSATLASNGISVLDVPCDQLAEYSSTKIRDLVRVSLKEKLISNMNHNLN